MTSVAVGIDIGGTTIAGALISADGTIVHEHTVSTPRADDGADPAGTTTATLVVELLHLAEAAGHEIAGVGVGVPEYVDTHGRIASSMVMAWDADPASWLATGRDASDGPPAVTVDSDVRCAALAEARLGHGRGVASCLFVTIGTGISHAMVIDGVIWRGHRGEAIALGELPVSSDDVVDGKAALTVEAQASGLALERVAAEFGLSPLDRADERLETARRRAGRVVGTALASAVALLDPEIVVVGGGLGTSFGSFFDEVSDRFLTLTATRPAAPPLLRSALGTRAGVVGAGLIVHERRGDQR